MISNTVYAVITYDYIYYLDCEIKSVKFVSKMIARNSKLIVKLVPTDTIVLSAHVVLKE